MTAKVECQHIGCHHRTGLQGLGWGLSTGTVQWFCSKHWLVELVRLARLLRCVGAMA